MTQPSLDVRGLEFTVVDPTDRHDPNLTGETWPGCHAVATVAFQAEWRHRSPEQIRALFGSVEDFQTYHMFPQRLVEEGRLNPQDITKPALAVATDAKKEIVGFAYSANTVTGDTEAEKFLKAWSTFNKYRWLQIIAVDPNYQGRGVAQVLGFLSFSQAMFLQPASAYTWPAESSAGARLLTQWGMLDDGGKDQKVHPFVKNGGTVILRQHTNNSARGVAREIVRQSPDGEVLRSLAKRYGV